MTNKRIFCQHLCLTYALTLDDVNLAQCSCAAFKAYAMTHRQPFETLDEHLDAPDGAVLYLDKERGWYTRRGNCWYPISFGEAMTLLKQEKAALGQPSRLSG